MTVATRPHLKPSTLQVLDLLRERESVTAIDALSAVGCFRLAGRVHELRAAGFVVESDYVTTGSGKRICAYRLRERHVDRGTQIEAFG